MSRSVRPDDAITIPVAPLRRLMLIVVAFVAVVLFIALAIGQRDRIRAVFGGAEADYIDATTYQSVVLTTNQVYFGKLKIDGDVYTLTDVYSLSASGDSGSGTVQLVKRGNELHGPQEPLVIPGRSVLFFENMRPDSQVMKAIAQIRSGNVQPAPAATTPAATLPARTATPAPSASR